MNDCCGAIVGVGDLVDVIGEIGVGVDAVMAVVAAAWCDAGDGVIAFDAFVWCVAADGAPSGWCGVCGAV